MLSIINMMCIRSFVTLLFFQSIFPYASICRPVCVVLVLLLLLIMMLVFVVFSIFEKAFLTIPVKG